LWAFWSLLAAAAFWSAFFVAGLFLPGLGLQLPFSPGVEPGVGSKPGQQWLVFLAADFLLADFFAGAFLLADFFAVVMSC
jgi:hypothetical protein